MLRNESMTLKFNRKHLFPSTFIPFNVEEVHETFIPFNVEEKGCLALVLKKRPKVERDNEKKKKREKPTCSWVELAFLISCVFYTQLNEFVRIFLICFENTTVQKI